MPNANRDIRKEFRDKRIPTAQLFDVDEISDKSIPLPHMLPKKADFERQVSELGISNDDHIVCYDQSGIYFASARVWWTFRVFGHDNVSVLDGGIQKWQAAGFDVVSGPAEAPKKVRITFSLLFRRLGVGGDSATSNISVLEFVFVWRRTVVAFTPPLMPCVTVNRETSK
jgi:thiosulfate/3-mercaptopyruvate sulfurtransferase